MTPLRIGINASLLLLLFAIQETVVSRVHLPFTGFSFYLACVILLVTLENRTGAVIIGFTGGIILDLSPSSQSPFGQWALILTGISYLIAVNAESIDDLVSRPVGVGIFVATAATFTLLLYLLMNLLLGEAAGTFGHDFIVIFGNAFWTVLAAPFLMKPIFGFRNATLGSRDRK